MSSRNRGLLVIVIGAMVLTTVGAWFVSRAEQRSGTPAASDSASVRADQPLETNWPQFRGPTFDAISTETDLVDSWPDEGPPVAWTRELGEGYSSFAAAGNHVFTQYQSLYQQHVVCLDAETGHPVWSHSYAWPFEGGGLYPGPRSTPTWNNGRIYFAAPDGTVGCLDAKSGASLWSVNPKKQYRGRGTDFGYSCSPVVIEGKVIVPIGGDGASVVALDAANGSVVWASGDSAASYATPLPISWKGKSRVVVPLENSLAAFDVASGKHLWEIEFSVGYDEHSAAPLYAEPLLCIAAPFQAGAKCYRLVERSSQHDAAARLDPDIDASAVVSDSKAKSATDDESAPVQPEPDQETTQLTWESFRFSNDVCSSVLYEGRLYGFDLNDAQSRMNRPSKGAFRCLDFQTGNVIWSTNQVGQSTMIVADQKLILFTDSGQLILARLGTDEYTELARTTVFRDEICWTSPALHRGRLFLRTMTRAACIDLRKTPTASPKPQGRVQDIPRGRWWDARFLIGSEREFPAAVPTSPEFVAWYLWSLASLGLASVINILVWLAIRFTGSGPTQSTAEVGTSINTVPSEFQNRLIWFVRVLFWLEMAFVGAAGSPLINAHQSEYVLLWPFALWAVFQSTMNVITWTERQTNRRWLRWISRAAVATFIGTCVFYFSLCRSLGYAVEWAFLVGFLPGFLIAAWAARWLTTRNRYWPVTDALFPALSWTIYFWSSVIFITWKLSVGT